MGCGAEVPPRATACLVCGRDTGRSGEVRTVLGADENDGAGTGAAATAGSGVSLDRAAPPVPVAVPLPVASPVAVAGPSIGSGDLDQPGFPRDALGRSLIFTVVAMAADLLAPWVNLGGSRVAPSALGVPALLGLVWLGVAALPLLRPSLRATPLYAVAPLVVGATSLGLGMAVWLRVTLFEAQTVVAGADGTSLQALGASNSADVGLYLFLAGAVVLIVAGYQVFMAAARAQALAELRAGASLPAPSAATSAARQRATSSGRGTATADAGRTPAAATSAAPSNGATPAAPDSHPLPPPPAASPTPQHGVALPGSAAWSQTPNTPSFQRPSPTLGWRRHGP